MTVSRPATKFLQTNWQPAILIALLSVFFAINVLSLDHLAPTADEEKHYLYGTNILELNADRFDDSKMPFSVLNALPNKLSGLFPAGQLRTFMQKFYTARLVTILFSMGVAYMVSHWAKQLYGSYAGLLALFLYTWDPNIIAHSMLVTTDIFALGMMLFSLYFFWKFLNQPTWKNGILSAFVLGLSQLAKYTCVFLYPLFLLLVIVFFFQKWFLAIKQREYRKLIQHVTGTILYALIFILISILIINVGFLFNRTFLPLQSYNFSSELFQTVQDKLAGAGNLPVPVPYPYIEGLDLVRFRERTGFGFGRMYLFGELREHEGFKGYYFYATLLKMPVAIQIVVLAALVAYLRKFKVKPFLQNEEFLLLPALFFTVYFNFFYRAQIGIRYFIVVFPLLYILCGSLLQHWEQISLRQKAVGGVLSIYLVLSVLSYHPHYIPYFNEIVWDRRFAYKYLADSNLDWGQAEFYLEDYLAENPNARVEPLQPRDGTTIVSVNALVGVVDERDKYAWLRENFDPVDTIAYMYLVYKISTPEFRSVFPPP